MLQIVNTICGKLIWVSVRGNKVLDLHSDILKWLLCHLFPKQRWRMNVNNQSREPIGQDNHVVSAQNYVHNLILSRVFGDYSMAIVFYKYAHLPTLSLSLSFPICYLQEPTHSLQYDFQREPYHSLVSTNSCIPPQKGIFHTTILLLVTPFWWDFFSFKNKRNFVKPPKETNK